MKRREFIKTATTGLALSPFLKAQTFVPAAAVDLRPGEASLVISPHLYGHFIEHIGGVIYDGIWVGQNSKIAHFDGIRRQFVEDMRRIAAPNLRWPGGCFADGYHWRDGLGPTNQRPKTYNFWQPRMPEGVDATESNHFGTHEFMRLCKLLDAQPYVAANIASGTPKELHDWVLYCNAPVGTVSLARERAHNGHYDPFNARYWGIGNESWGCGGNFKPPEYALEYSRFVTQFPRYSAPFLIAAGPNGDDLNWTRGFFEAMEGGRGSLVHGWALHYYTHYNRTKTQAQDFTPDQWYGVLDAGTRIEKLIEDHWSLMGEFDKEHRVKLVIDEWGTWHAKGSEVSPRHLFGQVGTLRDALHAAITLDIFNRHADKIVMANIAQTINCLHSLFIADGDRYVRTPTFHVFEMYRGHRGGKLVPAQIHAPLVEYTGPEGPAKMFGLAGSASLKQDRVTVTLVNPSLEIDLPVKIDLRVAVREARGTVLTHLDMRRANTFDAPDEVVPHALPVSLDGNKVIAHIPRQSVSALQILIP